MTNMDEITTDGTWYVLQIMSGQENRVKKNLEFRHQQALSEGFDYGVQEVYLPGVSSESSEEGAAKTPAGPKLYPGYIFVLMNLFDDDGRIITANWHFINNTPGVIGFIGGEMPVPISVAEIEEIKEQLRSGGEKIKAEAQFKPGDLILFRKGPFEGCEGAVESVDADHSRLKASVQMFGRSTIVEAEFWQVEPAPIGEDD